MFGAIPESGEFGLYSPARMAAASMELTKEAEKDDAKGDDWTPTQTEVKDRVLRTLGDEFKYMSYGLGNLPDGTKDSRATWKCGKRKGYDPRAMFPKNDSFGAHGANNYQKIPIEWKAVPGDVPSLIARVVDLSRRKFTPMRVQVYDPQKDQIDPVPVFYDAIAHGWMAVMMRPLLFNKKSMGFKMMVGKGVIVEGPLGIPQTSDGNSLHTGDDDDIFASTAAVPDPPPAKRLCTMLDD